MEFILRGGIAIPRQYENEMWYREIRSDLLRRSKKYNTPDFDILKFYLESEKFLTIPRFYPLDKFIDKSQYTLVDKRQDGEIISIEHNIKPKNDLQNRAITHMLNNESSIMELQPGTGKTVISIFVISTRKRKSLILVHRDSLVEQWIERFRQYTNLSINSISRLSSSNFKEALKNPIIISTNQTILSILKNHRIDFLVELNKANIGIFVSDECHTTSGAPTFSECSIHIPSKIIYGLSATPYRWDGNGDIIEYHLGDIFKEEDDSGTMSSIVNVILMNYQIDQPKRYGYLYWGGQFQRSRYLNLMRKSEPFLKSVKALLTKFKEKRKVIFMCERLNLIDLLYNWLPHSDKSVSTAGIKNEALKKQIVFTTSGKCRDGVDIPEKDCLILTSPISNINQACGRVTRTHENKQTPIIIDYVDIGCPPIKNTCWSRFEYYNKKGWPINYIFVDDEGFPKQTNEEEALKILKEKG